MKIAKIFVFLAVFLASPAMAQWQVPDHSVPVGRGAGTGFRSAAPGTSGLPLISSGSSSDPAFGAISGSAFSNQSANTVFSGPSSGGAASPAFRSLVGSDIPAIDLSTTGAGGVTGTLPVGPGGTGATSFTANAPLIGNGTSPLTVGSRSGNTTTFATTSGTLTSGDCVQFDASGNLVAAGAACGSGSGSGWTNTLNTVTANYTVQTSDCGKTIQAGTGSTGLFTVTLPSVSGFSSTCIVVVINNDTSRGKTLSGFPSPIYCMLYPSQSVMVGIVNGAWAPIAFQQRWTPGASVTFHINTSSGSDSCSADGLSTGAAAFASPVYAYRVYQQRMQGTSTAGESVTAHFDEATVTITTDFTFTGPPAPGYIETSRSVPFRVVGDGPSSTTVQSTTNSVNLFNLQGGAHVAIDQMTVKASGTGAFCFVVDGAESLVEISTLSGGSIWFDQCTAGIVTATAGTWRIVGSHTWLNSSHPNLFAIAEAGATGIYPAALTISGTPSTTVGFVVVDVTSRIEMTGFTFTGTATGPRGAATSNGVIHTPTTPCGSLPGNSAVATATGGLCL